MTSIAATVRGKADDALRQRDFPARFNSMEAHFRAEIATELGIREPVLVAMASLSLISEGLDRVLGLLDLDARELERQAPTLVADLRRSCAMCRDWKDCALDLDTGVFAREAGHYCVNRYALRRLLAGRAPQASVAPR